MCCESKEGAYLETLQTDKVKLTLSSLSNDMVLQDEQGRIYIFHALLGHLFFILN